MTDKKLTLNLTSDKYNFIIEGRSIDKIRVFNPLVSSFSFECCEDEENFYLEGFDYLANYKFGDKKDISYYRSLKPKTIRVQVPDSLITNLKINAKGGNIFLKDIILENVELSSINGKIVVSNCNSDFIDINGFDTKVTLDNVSGEKCFIKTSNGDIKINDNFPNETHLTTYKGDISTSLMEEDYNNTFVNIITRKNTVVQTVNNEKKITKRLVMKTENGSIQNKKY